MSIVQSDRCIDLYSRYIFVDCSTFGFDNARFLAIANWLSLEQTLRLTRSGQEKNAQSFESIGCVTPSDSLGARMAPLCAGVKKLYHGGLTPIPSHGAMPESSLLF
jgi:hypothetical protein